MQKLQSPQLNFQRGCLLIFAFGWTAFACLFAAIPLIVAVPVLFQGESSIRQGGIMLLVTTLFSLPFIAIGIGLLAWAIRPLMAGIHVSKPEISVSNPTPRVGEEIDLMYSVSFKRPSDVAQILLQLIFRETATYRRGTNTYTVKQENVVQQFEHPGRHFDAGETFHDRHTLTIPLDGMHTFSAFHNKLQWWVKAQVKIAGWPDAVEEYEIKVLPERVR